MNSLSRLTLFGVGAGIVACLAPAQSKAQWHHRWQQTPTAVISVTPSTITAGQRVTVNWSSRYAVSATLNGVSVPTAGSLTLTPPASTTETLTVRSAAGRTTTRSATITVTAPSTSTTSSGSTSTSSGSTSTTSGSTSTTSGSTSTSTSPTTSPSPSTGTGPHINYTDLNVGSGTGGDNGNGVYVRIFGSNFGSSQGSSTVSLGGSLVTSCSLCSWSNTEITAQIGPAAQTGKIVVNVNGVPSNGVPFTVTPTTIVFVSPNGNDNNPGSFAAPFKTWRAAFNSVTGGDNSAPSQNTVIYLEPGVNVSFDDGRGYSATISTDIGGSSPTSQLNIVGYPGGTVNVGSTSVSNGVHGWGKYITLANLNIVGGNSAIDAEAGNIRIINNTLSCPAPPSGLGGTACVLGETDTPSDTWVFDGNVVDNTGGNVDKTYHAIYFSSNANHADVGWNNVGQGFKGYCRSIMFHATTGSNLYDIHIHDNVITGGYCDGIGLASVDPSQGTVEVYNNVLSHIALASNPYGVANEAGIAINSDPAGSTSGNVLVYNNTVVDAGAYTTGNQNGCFGIVTAGAGMILNNNICDQPSSAEPYIEPGTSGVSGSKNLWYGAGAPPSWDSAPINSDPNFASTQTYSLSSSSPAKLAGTSSQASPIDIVGTSRTTAPSMGAYQ